MFADVVSTGAMFISFGTSKLITNAIGSGCRIAIGFNKVAVVPRLAATFLSERVMKRAVSVRGINALISLSQSKAFVAASNIASNPLYRIPISVGAGYGSQKIFLNENSPANLRFLVGSMSAMGMNSAMKGFGTISQSTITWGTRARKARTGIRISRRLAPMLGRVFPKVKPLSRTWMMVSNPKVFDFALRKGVRTKLGRKVFQATLGKKIQAGTLQMSRGLFLSAGRSKLTSASRMFGTTPIVPAKPTFDFDMRELNTERKLPVFDSAAVIH